MKALMGELAKKIRKDVKGREAMKLFLTEGATEKTIKLSDGKKYRLVSKSS
ncbi:hypothetical protein L9G74_13635 [Shewanella sp. C32]|uniref:Uncharacterized protein n=1 Tax=Shewanella electrica TaxID=515560 RepID=A0ABT2FMC7_9GAMM|nr:hypothetical protein [Shewanella electrica]MCH1927085.1 hypothetical protein [Shewanella electrica]MCS4557488.1 hypothetical protein [Shewanella electrica]